MIGISLPYNWLASGEGEPHLDKEALLRRLYASGVRSVELRTVLYKHDPCQVLAVAEMLWNLGFTITVHSHMRAAETAVEDVFGPLSGVLSSLRQRSLTLVLHLIDGDNLSAVTALSDYAVERGYPVTVALENNRLLPNGDEGDCAAFVLDIMKRVGRDNVRLCFDLGHYMYFVKKHGKDNILPPEEFRNNIAQTHIHALDGLKTHYPLDTYELPLCEMLEGFAWRYFGVYNIELDFPRWGGMIDEESAIFGSIEALKSALPLCAKLYDKIRDEFDAGTERALGVYKAEPATGAALGLLNSTGYLFNTGGYKWAMDIALRFANYLADTKDRLTELFSDVSLMVVTHGHVDHFEESTVRALAKTDMTWVIPDFLYDNAIEWDVRPEKIIIAHPNKPICIDKLTILPFMGRHFRPVTHKGVDEYGYYITAEGAPSMVFPADVRDYAIEGLPDIPKADICFGHVFLGDGQAFSDNLDEAAETWSRFMLKLSDKRIVLAHLYENGRRDEDMWRDEHAELISRHLRALAPEVEILVPHHGDVLDL